MLSLETAKKLKDAGLQWKPQVGDWFYTQSGNLEFVAFKSSLAAEYIKTTNGNNEHYPNSRLMTGAEIMQEDFVFAPRLDQMLVEIEKRGWTWMLYAPNDEGKYGIDIGNGSIYDNNKTILADSPDEAAAQALLWILERETNDRIKSDCQRRSQNPGWMNGNGGKA